MAAGRVAVVKEGEAETVEGKGEAGRGWAVVRGGDWEVKEAAKGVAAAGVGGQGARVVAEARGAEGAGRGWVAVAMEACDVEGKPLV